MFLDVIQLELNVFQSMTTGYQNNSLKVGNNEGSLMTGVKLPNLLGRGERLQVCCEWPSPQCLNQSKTKTTRPITMRLFKIY